MIDLINEIAKLIDLVAKCNNYSNQLRRREAPP